MKFILLMMFFTPSLYAQTIYKYEVTRVIDGDTVEFIIPDLPKELGKVKLRIFGIDSPESGFRAKCEKEKKMAKAATNYAKSILATAADIGLTIHGWDKYGGRVIGDLIINGRSFHDIMIEKKLVREYNGGKKKTWCTE